MIAEQVITYRQTAGTFPDSRDGTVTTAVIKRIIPKDVAAALSYMEAYKRADAKLVKAFIESLL